MDMTSSTLKVVTYNMHKGRSFWLRNYCIRHMREKIHALEPDILFLQETPGVHPRGFQQPLEPVAYFAELCGKHYCYGKNAVYKKGHHGNAIVSRLKLHRHTNTNISETKLAVRGLLHAELELPSSCNQILHLLNVHLDLFEQARRRQAAFILNYIQSEISKGAPVILAGDFNDWRCTLDDIFLPYLHRADNHGQTALKTSPSAYPIYDLDRIYTRNIHFYDIKVEKSASWARLSDHLPLSGTVAID